MILTKQQIEDLLVADRQMTPADLDNLVVAYVEPDPRDPSPGEARIRGEGVPVWALVGHLDAVEGDLESLAAAYRLPVDAILAAVAYYRRHKEAIDARLAANAA